MDIALLITEPNMGCSALDQKYFILVQVPVLNYGRPWGQLLRTQHEVPRAVVFRADLEHELAGGNRGVVSVNAASPQFAFVPFQQKRLNYGILTWSGARLNGMSSQTAEPNLRYRYCRDHTPACF